MRHVRTLWARYVIDDVLQRVKREFTQLCECKRLSTLWQHGVADPFASCHCQQSHPSYVSVTFHQIASLMLGLEVELHAKFLSQWLPNDRDPGSTALVAFIHGGAGDARHSGHRSAVVKHAGTVASACSVQLLAHSCQSLRTHVCSLLPPTRTALPRRHAIDCQRGGLPPAAHL